MPNALRINRTAIIMNNTFTITGNGSGSGINDTAQYTSPRMTIDIINEIIGL